MTPRVAAGLGVLAFLLVTARETAHAQAPLADSTSGGSPSTASVAVANLRAGITISPAPASIQPDTAAENTGTHRRAHALKGAAIGAVTGAAAGIVAAALVDAADRRHPERHGGVVDKRPSARFFLMGILGVLGAGAGALAGATVGALIP